MGRYVALAFAGRVDDALALTCLGPDERPPLRALVVEAVGLWPPGVTPALAVERVIPLDADAREITYTLELPDRQRSFALSARVTGGGDDARLCGASTSSSALVLDNLQDLAPVRVAWPAMPPVDAVAAAAGWDGGADGPDRSPREDDASRRITTRWVRTLTQPGPGDDITARVTYVEFASSGDRATDLPRVRPVLAARAHLTVEVPGVPTWGVAGGMVVNSYLQPPGVGARWDSLTVVLEDRPAVLNVLVEGLPASESHDRARRLLLALLYAPA